MQELSLKSTIKYRKTHKELARNGNQLGTGQLGPHPNYHGKPNENDYKLEHKKIKNDLARLELWKVLYKKRFLSHNTMEGE